MKGRKFYDNKESVVPIIFGGQLGLVLAILSVELCCRVSASDLCLRSS